MPEKRAGQHINGWNDLGAKGGKGPPWAPETVPWSARAGGGMGTGWLEVSR